MAEMLSPHTTFPQNSEAGLKQQSSNPQKSASDRKAGDVSTLEPAGIEHRLSLFGLSSGEEHGADKEKEDRFSEDNNSDGCESEDDDGESCEEVRRSDPKESKGKGKEKETEVFMEQGDAEIEVRGPYPASHHPQAVDPDDEDAELQEAIAASRLQQVRDTLKHSEGDGPESSRAAQARFQNCTSTFSTGVPDSEDDLYGVPLDEEPSKRGDRASQAQDTDQAGEQVEGHNNIMADVAENDAAVEERQSGNSIESQGRDIVIEERSGTPNAMVSAVEESEDTIVRLERHSENIPPKHSAYESESVEAELSGMFSKSADTEISRTPPHTQGSDAPGLADPALWQRLTDHVEDTIIKELADDELEIHQALVEFYRMDIHPRWKDDMSEIEHTLTDSGPSTAAISIEPAASRNCTNPETFPAQDNSRVQHQGENMMEQQESDKDGGLHDATVDIADDEKEEGRDEGEKGAEEDHDVGNTQHEQGT